MGTRTRQVNGAYFSSPSRRRYTTPMPALTQQIRFCASPDGARIAYATSGSGAPLVKASNWLSHLEFDWQSPVWMHLLQELGRGHTLVRYDERGCGLSDWDAELSFEHWVRDLEAVVDACGLIAFRCSVFRRALRLRSPTQCVIPSALPI